MEALDDLLVKIVSGDCNAFAKLYNYYKEPCIRFSNAIIKDEEEAENILHEVFIKLWNRRDQINPELNFNAYLYTCLRNMAFDHLKKIEKNQSLKDHYFRQMNFSQEPEYEVEEAKISMLRVEMAKLPEKRKMILKLNVEEGKSYQEIAELMRISKNTVKNQLVKAKQFLREGVNLSLAL